MQSLEEQVFLYSSRLIQLEIDCIYLFCSHIPGNLISPNISQSVINCSVYFLYDTFRQPVKKNASFVVGGGGLPPAFLIGTNSM